jgi:hypothetical protein
LLAEAATQRAACERKEVRRVYRRLFSYMDETLSENSFRAEPTESLCAGGPVDAAPARAENAATKKATG